VIAADTGPLHLACAVATPVVALFGPTDPGRNGPFAREDVVVRRMPPCAPCYSRTCVRHAGVMAGIGVSEVLSAAERRLAAAREGASRAL
jgi:ADP-heptose:LPS heptosyltransferase